MRLCVLFFARCNYLKNLWRIRKNWLLQPVEDTDGSIDGIEGLLYGLEVAGEDAGEASSLIHEVMQQHRLAMMMYLFI